MHTTHRISEIKEEAFEKTDDWRLTTRQRWWFEKDSISSERV